MKYEQLIRSGIAIIVGSLIWFMYTVAQTGARRLVSENNFKCVFSFSESCTHFYQPYSPILIYVGTGLLLFGFVKGVQENIKD